MNDKWLKKLHDRMADFETDAPDGLWESIQAARRTSAVRRHLSPIVTTRIKRTAVAAALLVMVLAAVYVVDHGQSDMPSFRYAVSDGDDIVKPEVGSVGLLSIIDKPTLTVERPVLVAERHVGMPSSAERSDDDVSDTIPVSSEPDSMGRQAEVDRQNEITTLPRAGYSRNIATAKRAKRHDDRFSIGMYSSMGSGSSINGRSSALYSSVGVYSLYSESVDDAVWRDRPMLGMLLYNRDKDIVTDVRHRLPVRVGMTVSYAVSRRLAIESGFTYANLVSDMTVGSEGSYYEGRQDLHYVGIPVNVRYNVLSWKRLDLYGSAGVLAEKCVAAKIGRDYVIGGHAGVSESESLPDKPFQFSVNASVGLQFNLSKTVGIYVEPGAGYYFDDGSSLRTVYKDKPFNFNIDFGLRFTFGRK